MVFAPAEVRLLAPLPRPRRLRDFLTFEEHASRGGQRCVSGRVTQKFVERAIAGLPITIDGDGSAKHDFTYIADLVDGVDRVLTNPKAKGETFNLTTGEARSLADLANIIKFHFPDLQVTYGPPDLEKPSRGTMSIQKAHDLLGFTPRYSLEAGMAEYIAWNKAFFQRQKKAA